MVNSTALLDGRMRGRRKESSSAKVDGVKMGQTMLRQHVKEPSTDLVLRTGAQGLEDLRDIPRLSNGLECSDE